MPEPARCAVGGFPPRWRRAGFFSPCSAEMTWEVGAPGSRARLPEPHRRTTDCYDEQQTEGTANTREVSHGVHHTGGVPVRPGERGAFWCKPLAPMRG